MKLDSESLWKKARLNLDHAIEFRDAGDHAKFHFWATVSLELLGKSCLCSLHPVFVVDPTDFKSVRIACGNLESDDYRTIIAKTVYQRLHELVDGFDEKAMAFCGRMAGMRNEELHSAKLPFEGVDLRSWQSSYWKVVKLLCENQGRTLEDLLGTDEAEAAEKIIANANVALEVAVRGRITQAGMAFRGAKGEDIVRSQVELSRQNAKVHCGEADVISECPACGGYGLLEGTEIDEDYVRYLPDELGTAEVTLSCEAERFRCFACELRLSGLDEIKVANLPEEFQTVAYREYEWEPDYGND